MLNTLHNRLPAFLHNLECRDTSEQHDAFVNEVQETFGRFDPPSGDRSHRWELDLHAITADGATEEEAIANWKRLAGKLCQIEDIEDDGFITVHPAPDQLGAA
ncbi:hypothetical protein [Aliiroseovarius lamellibrachiae]|uniref:hypothetical protein n=1 Tax=Aliiroseovarius lamellibrachiae TaxID=1924933 RepID=UPI001BE010D7|nr:hypothetical protein [Aliiroseovarius lamellibrachiae]MBT2130095.1 hypothetical protein [Aliiroseovarius lamellibrachiae]